MSNLLVFKSECKPPFCWQRFVNTEVPCTPDESECHCTSIVSWWPYVGVGTLVVNQPNNHLFFFFCFFFFFFFFLSSSSSFFFFFLRFYSLICSFLWDAVFVCMFQWSNILSPSFLKNMFSRIRNIGTAFPWILWNSGYVPAFEKERKKKEEEEEEKHFRATQYLYSYLFSLQQRVPKSA